MVTRNILLLEDEDVIWMLYEKALVSKWHNVTWVKSLPKFRSVLKRFDFDIIFLDQCVNWDFGFLKSLLEKLRWKFPHAQIIILSNYSKLMSIDNNEDLLIDDYIIKCDMRPSCLVSYIHNLY